MIIERDEAFSLQEIDESRKMSSLLKDVIIDYECPDNMRKIDIVDLAIREFFVSVLCVLTNKNPDNVVPSLKKWTEIVCRNIESSENLRNKSHAH